MKAALFILFWASSADSFRLTKPSAQISSFQVFAEAGLKKKTGLHRLI
jgi:hypothetical protein